MISRVAQLAVRNLVKRSPLLLQPSRQSHILHVPPVNHALTDFVKGVPAKAVRNLEEWEAKWDFWTSSDIYNTYKPKFGGLSYVPNGEIWVLERGGQITRSIGAGVHFLLPYIDKLRCIKSPNPVAIGVLSKGTTENGVRCDLYAVMYVEITDAVKSASYENPETARLDSEHAIACYLGKLLRQNCGSYEMSGNGDVSADVKKAMEKSMAAEIAKREDEYGLQLLNLELRGVWEVSHDVPNKLRAMDPVAPHPDQPGHNLSADYWADVITPSYFEKRTFGSYKEVKTPATVSLEWSIPSPPDYHHFNELPRLTVTPDYKSDWSPPRE